MGIFWCHPFTTLGHPSFSVLGMFINCWSLCIVHLSASHYLPFSDATKSRDNKNCGYQLTTKVLPVEPVIHFLDSTTACIVSFCVGIGIYDSCFSVSLWYTMNYDCMNSSSSLCFPLFEKLSYHDNFCWISIFLPCSTHHIWHDMHTFANLIFFLCTVLALSTAEMKGQIGWC